MNDLIRNFTTENPRHINADWRHLCPRSTTSNIVRLLPLNAQTLCRVQWFLSSSQHRIEQARNLRSSRGFGEGFTGLTSKIR